MGGFYPARRLVEADLAFCLVGRVVSEDTMETCRVETELVCNACSYARLLPESCTLDVLARVARVLARARLLEHATADAGASLPHLLDLLAPGIGEAASDLWLCGFLVHAEVGGEVGLRVGVHGDWPRLARALVQVVAVGDQVVFGVVVEQRVQRAWLQAGPLAAGVGVEELVRHGVHAAAGERHVGVHGHGVGEGHEVVGGRGGHDERGHHLRHGARARDGAGEGQVAHVR